MSSHILMTPLASMYLSQFTARPDLGQIEVPILLRAPEGLTSQPVTLDAAIVGLGESYLDQVQGVIAGVDAILKNETVGSVPATGGRWGAVRSMQDQLTTFYRHGPGPHSLSVGLSPERNEHRLKVKISLTTNHSETTMEQVVRSVEGPQRLVCDAPRYSIYLHKFAVVGLRHYLGLPELTPLAEVVPAILDSLGIRQNRMRVMDPLKPTPVIDPDDIHEIGYTASMGLDGPHSVFIEGALQVDDLEDARFEEWLNIDVKSNSKADRRWAGMQPELLEIWNLAGIYLEEPSEEDAAAYRRLTAKIYTRISGH